MKDYTIGESYELPSLGKVYPVEFDPLVKIRSMTTEEEMKRVASTGDYTYRNMSEIIDDCLVDYDGISSYDMCIGDYQFLLHKLRTVTYGPEYTIINKCPYCGCETEDTINLDELPVIKYTEDFDKFREFELPKSKHTVKLRVQTPRMLDNVNVKVKDFKRKYANQTQKDPTIVYLLEELIEEIDGQRPNPVKLEDWIRALPMGDTNMIIQHAEKMNELIGIDINLICVCGICGLDFRTALRATSDFFRPTIRF